MKSPARERNWDGVAAVVAAVIGLLALLVSGYTAYVERQQVHAQLQQVRAQVWPYLEIGVSDNDHSLGVFNKGMGPAIIRSVQIQVDGKPQADWRHVLGRRWASNFIITLRALSPTMFYRPAKY
jgi:hypothetical protein